MAGSQSNAVRRVDVDPALSGVERIKLLLFASGYRSVAAFARLSDELEQDVWHAITGKRRNATTNRVLEKIAAAVDRPRSVIDALIGEAAKDAVQNG